MTDSSNYCDINVTCIQNENSRRMQSTLYVQKNTSIQTKNINRKKYV